MMAEQRSYPVRTGIRTIRLVGVSTLYTGYQQGYNRMNR